MDYLAELSLLKQWVQIVKGVQTKNEPDSKLGGYYVYIERTHCVVR